MAQRTRRRQKPGGGFALIDLMVTLAVIAIMAAVLLPRIQDDGRLVKINPLADWGREDVMKFIRDNGVPVNRLHQRGFPSVGCAPCSRAIQPGEDVRAGRWWWENPEDKECGLHVGEEQEGSGI